MSRGLTSVEVLPVDDRYRAAARDGAYGDAFAQIDARQALTAALDRLPPRQRAVVVLRYFGDQTEAQTAAAMGCSVGAVKAHASKALARLRDTPGLAELMTGGVTS